METANNYRVLKYHKIDFCQSILNFMNNVKREDCIRGDDSLYLIHYGQNED